MLGSSDKDQRKKKINEVKTFSVPFALETIKENIAISTNNPSKPSKEQIINQAFNFHSQGNIAKAAKYYQHFINQGFKDHRVFSNYGVIQKSLGKLKEAELSQRKAIEIKPDYVEAHSNLGNILKDLGKLEEAELSQRKAIALNPDFANAHCNLGNILKDLGKLKEAEVHYRKAIELNPDISEAHYNLGIILSDLKKLNNSISSFKKAIELGMDLNLCLSNIGQVLLDQGNYDEGITKIKEGEGAIKFDLKNGLSFN